VSAEWKRRREGGGWLGIWLFRNIGRHGGRTAARLLLYPVTLYYLLRRGEERRDSRAYLQRVLGRPARLRDVARHIHTFAATILDRVFLLGEDMRRFDVTVTGLDDLHRQLDRGQGVLLFGSHLGSFEVLRVLARRRPEFTIRVVLDKAHSPMLTQLLDALNPDIAATVIDGSQDGPAIMLAIQEAAAQGAIVALLVDRAQPGQPVVAAPFLGAPAEFPVAPWLMAAVLKVPVVLAFGLYRGGNRYDLAFESFSDGLDIPRRERAAAIPALIRGYAARLEHYARLAPYNWFNFYDFWGQSDHDNADQTPAPPPRPAGRKLGPAVLPGGTSAGGDSRTG
jgi:predicted LPLAT superfamily acyltransferase